MAAATSRAAGSGSAGAPVQAEPRVCLGVIVGVHGVRGVVRIKPFTEEPEAVGAYGPVSDESGRHSYTLTVHGRHNGTVLAGIAGIADRETALALKGTRLYVARHALPEVAGEETFYHADLIGLAVVDRHGADLGRVLAVQDFGAGDLLEIGAADGGEWLLPFTREAVPEVDVAGGRIVADPPPEAAAEES